MRPTSTYKVQISIHGAIKELGMAFFLSPSTARQFVRPVSSRGGAGLRRQADQEWWKLRL